MTLQGTVIKLLPSTSGVSSKSGKEWNKQEVIVHTPGQYGKDVCLTLFNNAIERCAFVEGVEYSIEVDVESREYNGRWYTSINALRANPISGGQSVAPAQPQTTVAPAAPPIQWDTTPQAVSYPAAQPTAPIGQSDDLPF